LPLDDWPESGSAVRHARARSIGVDPHLDTELCEVAYDFVRQNSEQVRSSGMLGSAVPVPHNAEAATQLIAFLGRDPGWTGR